ncbi:hypothetical protein MTR67_029819 [Solanum verrucosum]|uniref:Prolamin-like domain-containing protein n=1 Tax=Solanum verrucosum TaxID=315347 RepID=A0AAF0R502_SOLVR|nr:hypothetical protein MTR67_029819 [Solanum verrucosum]
MARLNILSSFITILIISSAIPSLCKSHHHKNHPPPTIPPSQKEENAHEKYINSIPKKLLEYLENCTKYLPNNCGIKVLNATLHDKEDIDKKCCHDLVGMGLKCYKTLIKVYIGLPEVKDKIDSKVVKSNVSKVFKRCVALDKKKKEEEEEEENHFTFSPPILP